MNDTPIPVCQIHNAPEPSLPGDYRACGECWHVWRTHEEYVADVAAMDRQMNEYEVADTGMWGPAWNTDPDELAFCPLCSHDF
jgi:hypothetical protein